MNWGRLKSNAIAISLLLTGFPWLAIAKQSNFQHSKTENKQYCYITNYQLDTILMASEGKTGEKTAKGYILKLLKNLPKSGPSYFDSYSGVIFHRNRISTPAPPKTNVDSTNKYDFGQSNNKLLYSSEALVQQKMLKPRYFQSDTISTKTEGNSNGLFAMLNGQLNNASVLDPTVNLLNKVYLTPFSEASADNYNYTLADSITAHGDTLCFLDFCPKPDKPLDGFSGNALIDPKTFTFRKIIARSTPNSEKGTSVSIVQDFEQIEGAWLPSEIRIKVFVFIKDIGLQDIKKLNIDNGIVIEGCANFYQQETDIHLIPEDFKIAPRRAERDSSAIAVELDKQLNKVRLMAEGKISLGYFDLNYNRVLAYNLFEGFRLGVEGETNQKLSKHFKVGGFVSYGLKDQSVRSGEWVNIFPWGDPGFRFHLGYKDRNVEYGAPEFLGSQSLLNPENYRMLLIRNMYSSKKFTTGFEFHPFGQFKFFLFADQSENSASQLSPFVSLHPFGHISLARAGLQINFSPGKKAHNKNGLANRSNHSKSDFYLTLIQGLTILSGDYPYTKSEFKGRFDLPFSKMGTTTVMVRGGLMTPNSPIIEYFNGYGSSPGSFSITAPYSFATMQPNEFAATRFAAIHLRHDFGKWMFPENLKSRPAIVLAQNMGVGQLGDKYKELFQFQDYRKGFYESGIEINNLVRIGYLSWGVGLYYRYGPYRFGPVHENFAYKIGFSFRL